LQNIKTETQIEEDRRLFFVALTRAKNELYISYPLSKEIKTFLPSLFIEEIKEKCEEVSLQSTHDGNKKITDHHLYGVLKNTLQNNLIAYGQ
jgi:DNA helicase-2/ATP-dependent DNA helicase PcrA